MDRTLFTLFCLLSLCFCVAYSQPSDERWNLHLMSNQDGAACIDGTPPAYYFRAGKGSGANKWFLWHQGGGWCESLKDCYHRSNTPLGSSKNYPPTISTNTGYFSNDPSINPLMHNWNMVHFQYCDGGSFSGNNASVSEFNGKPLHFRGFRNLRLMANDLLSNAGLTDATHAVIGGCSAGGLATYLHADYWKSSLPTNAVVKAMPDSGFFLDYVSEKHYHSGLMWVFRQMNSTQGVNQRCVDHFSPNGLEWKCIFAQHTAPFVETPLFPLQSEYDAWQIGNELGSNNDAQINAYGALLTKLFRSAVLSDSKNGAFLDSCRHHCGDYWNAIEIDGFTQSSAFQRWFLGNDTTQFSFIQGKTYPCKPCCGSPQP